jgi:TonB family protein
MNTKSNLLVAIVLLAAPALSWADEQPAGPVAIGTPHACPDYPAASLASHTEGLTSVAFRIATDGSIHEVSVSKSSGSADLDQAAVACASLWRYRPALQNGKAVEAPWKADIVWRIQETSPLAAQFTHRCDGPASSAHELDEADIVFNVAATGAVKNVSVARSSGWPDFDAQLARCVSSWVYVPASENGRPIEAMWGARFDWNVRTGLLTQEGQARSHACNPKWYTARMEGEGTTVLSFRILKDGSVDRIAVAQSSGDPGLDAIDEKCVSGWRYRPATENGEPVEKQWGAQITWKQGYEGVVEIPPG